MEEIKLRIHLHPLNKQIYGEEENFPQDFLHSIEKFGIIHPIVVSKRTNRILSGNRRYKALLTLGLPLGKNVVFKDFESDLDEEEFLIEANRQRQKTASQILAEAKHLTRIYEVKAKENQLLGIANLMRGKTKPSPVLFKLNKTGQKKEVIQTQKIIAEKVGLSQSTFAKLEQVGKAAEKGERAKEVLREVDEGKRTIGSAYAIVKMNERRKAVEDKIKEQGQALVIPEGVRFGDAFKLIKDIPDKSIDAVITSPPFDLENARLAESDKTGPVYCKWLNNLLKEVERVTIDYAIIFNSSKRLADICRTTNPFRILLWVKTVVRSAYRYEPILVYKFDSARYNINARIWTDTLLYQPSEPQETFHYDQNPVALYEHLLGYVEGQTILDPFLGSGTTLRACKNLGKSCIGFELNEKEFKPIISYVGNIETKKGARVPENQRLL